MSEREGVRVPRIPIHIGDWRSDPRIRRLSRAERCDVLELLMDHWMEGCVPERPRHVSDECWANYVRIAPEYATERVRLERAIELKSKGGKLGNQRKYADKTPRIPIGNRSESDPSLLPTPYSPIPSVPTEPQESPPLASLAAPPAGGAARASPKAPKAKRAAGGWRRLPADYEPSAGARALAAKLGLDVREELDGCADWEYARTRYDPDATFRTWLRISARKQRAGPRGSDAPRIGSAAQVPAYPSAVETRRRLAPLDSNPETPAADAVSLLGDIAKGIADGTLRPKLQAAR